MADRSRRPKLRFDIEGRDDAKDLTAWLKQRLNPSPFQLMTEKNNERHFLLHWFQTAEITGAEKLSDSTARMTLRFPVLKEFENGGGSLHGGAHASIFDMATSWTYFLIAQPGFWMSGGLTRSLSCICLRPAMVGEWMVVESEIVQAGKRLSLVKAVMKREKDGALISTFEHNKYNVDADMPKM